MRRTWKDIGIGLLLMSAFGAPFFAYAETLLPSELEALEAEIQDRKAQIETIGSKLDEYKKKIAEYAKQSGTLMNEILLLENEVAMGELDVAATQAEMDTASLELQLLSAQLETTDEKLTRERELLQSLILAIHKQDAQGGAFELLLGARNFDEVFTAAAHLENVNNDLRKTLATTAMTRDELEDTVAAQEELLTGLDTLREELEVEIENLEEKKTAKEILAQQTAENEAEYRALILELRQEQQSIVARINELQHTVDTAQIDASDPNPTAISWPVNGIITARFHDPSYPFRRLFEHSGLDIAIPQGTAVGAAAPGVVAWAKTGPQYGNYVMIIHEGGLATLYAHLSRIDVQQDQFVARGDIIGLSGGRPGTQGAGLSTGSHLHFEVRKNGIPTDPLLYLP